MDENNGCIELGSLVLFEVLKNLLCNQHCTTLQRESKAKQQLHIKSKPSVIRNKNSPLICLPFNTYYANAQCQRLRETLRNESERKRNSVLVTRWADYPGAACVGSHDNGSRAAARTSFRGTGAVLKFSPRERLPQISRQQCKHWRILIHEKAITGGGAHWAPGVIGTWGFRQLTHVRANGSVNNTDFF